MTDTKDSVNSKFTRSVGRAAVVAMAAMAAACEPVNIPDPENPEEPGKRPPKEEPKDDPKEEPKDPPKETETVYKLARDESFLALFKDRAGTVVDNDAVSRMLNSDIIDITIDHTKRAKGIIMDILADAVFQLHSKHMGGIPRFSAKEIRMHFTTGLIDPNQAALGDCLFKWGEAAKTGKFWTGAYNCREFFYYNPIYGADWPEYVKLTVTVAPELTEVENTLPFRFLSGGIVVKYVIAEQDLEFFFRRMHLLQSYGIENLGFWRTGGLPIKLSKEIRSDHQGNYKEAYEDEWYDLPAIDIYETLKSMPNPYKMGASATWAGGRPVTRAYGMSMDVDFSTVPGAQVKTR